jgi:hypothetical protein
VLGIRVLELFPKWTFEYEVTQPAQQKDDKLKTCPLLASNDDVGSDGGFFVVGDVRIRAPLWQVLWWLAASGNSAIRRLSFPYPLTGIQKLFRTGPR